MKRGRRGREGRGAGSRANGGTHLDDIRGQGVHGAGALHVMQHAYVLAAAIHLAESSPDCRLPLYTLLLLQHTRSLSCAQSQSVAWRSAAQHSAAGY